jgi:hypothetical protein
MTERDALPRHTTPTWEMELLISGATVFALLLLPGVLDELFHAYFPRFSREAGALVLLPYLYVKTAVYALIVTFVLHLATRAYWVGLVGLRSVYGEAVLWDKLRWGPIYRRVLHERTPPVDVLIERADNRASLVFAYGVAFVLLTLAPLVLVATMALLTWLFQMATQNRFTWQQAWWGAMALLLLPLFLAMAVDRFAGARLRDEAPATRAMVRIFRSYLQAGLATASTYPMLTFMSRAGPKRGGLLLAVAFFALFGLTAVRVIAREGDIDIGSYGDLTLGEPGAVRALRNEHYAEYRQGAGLLSITPFIPSEVVGGDWLKLFVPFHPGRDPPGLRAECEPAPGTVDGALPDKERERLQADAARSRVLDCLARLYAPTLDGVAVDVTFDAADDPASGLRGAVAMLRVKDLTPGRHELTVKRLRSPLDEPEDPDPPPHRIVFWR